MRMNQPMGLSAAAAKLTAGLVPVDTGRFYEGYWDERFPLAEYVAPDSTSRLAGLLAEQTQLQAQLNQVEAAIAATGRELVTAGAHTYAEFEQATLYSSGPVMFLALRGPDGAPVEASLWSECGMEMAAEGHCYCAGAACVPGCPENCVAEGAEPAVAATEEENDWDRTV